MATTEHDGTARAAWPKRTTVALLAFEALLVVLDVVVNYLGAIDDEGIQQIFNVARELSIGNWLSSVLAAGVGVACLLLYVRERDRGIRGIALRGWWFLAAFFAYLGMDDGAQIHERVSEAVSRTSALVRSFPGYPWQVLFGPVLVGAGIFAVWFLRTRLETRSARVALSGLVLYAAAQGLDVVEGLDTQYRLLTARLALEPYAVPHFAKVAEESLEMVGVTLVLYALLGVVAGRSS